jgi:hypothetical protein
MQPTPDLGEPLATFPLGILPPAAVRLKSFNQDKVTDLSNYFWRNRACVEAVLT